jgi:hypothetical protein
MMTFMRQSLFTLVDALKKEIGWIAANLVCMLAPILFEWWLELPRSEWYALNGIDAWCTWMIWVLPFLAFIFTADIIWLVQVLRLNRGLERRRAFGAWLLVCCLWLVPFWINPATPYGLRLVVDMIDGQAFRH